MTFSVEAVAAYAESMGRAVTNPVALTIAGFDPSSGAGMTADLAVFGVHGVFGMSAITAYTVQSTLGVRRVEPVDAVLLRDTLQCLEEDLPPAGIKIGMLGGAAQVHVVVEYLRVLRSDPARRNVRVVLDPVVRSSSGAALLEDAGRVVLLEELLPLVDAVTPNTEELALLTGMPVDAEDAILAAAEELAAGRRDLAVVVTGGHRVQPDDLVMFQGESSVLRGQRIETRATHGTGCAFSSALLCGLLRGLPMTDAARAAKVYVAEAMRNAVPRGGGKGPMNLLWPLR